MNFISPIRTQAQADVEPILTIELAHVWRSKIIDKRAEAERYVCLLLEAGGGACSAKAPLSQKMESLTELLAAGACALRDKKIRPLLRRLRSLSDLRSELVHSTMSVAEVDRETIALLRHAVSDASRKILSLTDFKIHHRELSQIVNSLGQEADRTQEAGFPPSRE